MEHRVLIADDDPRTRAVLEHHLSEAGYTVVAAESGPAALDLLDADSVTLAVIDRDLPDDDAGALCRRIRGSANAAAFIVLLTTPDAKDRATTTGDLGADDEMLKPFSKDELLARLRAGARIVQLELALVQTVEQLARIGAELPDLDAALTDMRPNRASA